MNQMVSVHDTITFRQEKKSWLSKNTKEIVFIISDSFLIRKVRRVNYYLKYQIATSR